MDRAPEKRSARGEQVADYRGTGWRVGQLLALLGLTGFAVSQPLLAVAGEDTTLFTFAGVSGWAMVGFALIVALVPPLVLWVVVVAAGLVDRRVGDAVFIAFCGVLAGAAVIQWAKTIAGVDRAWLLAMVGLVAMVGFAVAVVRVPMVGLWVRYTAVLPVVALVLFLVASPASDLLRSRQTAPERSEDAGAGGSEETPPSVVFVMLDEFPLKTVLAEDGSIDEVRFPNLAALAGEATWYRDYTIQANVTRQSIPSLLSGRIPTGGAPTWTDHPDNLFSLLAPTHDLAAVESVTQLCGFTNCEVEGAQASQRRGIRSVLSQMVDVWGQRVSLDPIPEADLDQFAAAADPLDPVHASSDDEWDGSDERPEVDPRAVVEFIGALERSRTPSLSYLHLMLPHTPWTRFPDGRTFDGWSRMELTAVGAETGDWLLTQLNQAHIYQARYADHLLGEVIESLKARGIYDDSIVVVTADHGIGFLGTSLHDMRLPSPATMDSIAHVPLIIKSPGQSGGRVDDSNVMGIDLLPTIAAELGVDIPWEVDGFAAGSPEVEARGTTKVFYQFGVGWRRDLLGVIEFDVDETRPVASDRRVGPRYADEHTLSGLARSIEAEEWLGTHIEDLDVEPSEVEATLARVGNLQTDSVRVPGRLAGSIDPSASDGKVMLVFDGVVQSVAPIRSDGSFALMVPMEVEPHASAEVKLVQVSDGQVSELRLTDR